MGRMTGKCGPFHVETTPRYHWIGGFFSQPETLGFSTQKMAGFPVKTSLEPILKYPMFRQTHQ